MTALHESALVVVDVQRAFDDASYWGQRNNPACEGNIESLIEAFRSSGLPVVFVRHDSTRRSSPLHPASEGNAFKAELRGEPDLVVAKRVNSAFYGVPDLESWLREREIRAVTICGITTNHCCETTARMAANLGFDTHFAIDATFTFDRVGVDGGRISADALARVTAANLHDEFATVVETAEIVAMLAAARA